MTSALPALKVQPKTGNESFTDRGQPSFFSVFDFWRWAHSDLVVNTERGILAEFIVGQALGLTSKAVRREWDAFDFVTAEGLKIEVKSGAYIQSWAQRNFSPISFTVSPRRGWSDTEGYQSVPKRHADVYVLALLTQAV